MGYTHEMAEEDGQRVWCEGCGMNPAECMCEDEPQSEYDCETCQDTGEVTVDVFDNDSHTYQPTGTGRCHDCMGEDDADFSGATEGDR